MGTLGDITCILVLVTEHETAEHAREAMKNITRGSILVPFWGALALLSACAAGQTGGEVGDGTPGSGGGEGSGGPSHGGGCKVESERSLALDEVSSLGYSAEHVLAFAEGAHSAVVEWKSGSGEAVSLDTTPEAGSTELELQVTYDGGAITFLDREIQSSSGAEGGPGLGYTQCGDQLTIEVEVQLKTDNGAFDDTFPAKLTASTGSLATLHVGFAPENLTGSFRTEVLAPSDAVAKQFAVEASFVPGAFAGSITATVTGGNSQVAYAAGAEFARWPEGQCSAMRGVPLGVTEGLGKNAWDALVYSEPLPFQWEDGSETTLTLELEPNAEGGCYMFEGFSGSEYVELPVLAHAVTADDRIDGTWSLVAAVELSSGEPVRTTLYQRGFAAASPESFEENTGISGADLSGYEQGGFRLKLESDLTADPVKRSGDFAIVGLSEDECSTTPVVTPDGGAAPGCAGLQATDLERAAVGD